MKLQEKHAYESPRLEVIEIEMQGVLCSSVPQPINNAAGGTESVGRTGFQF